MSASHITGVILAGGMARRMGGRDKGLVSVASRPLVEYAIQALAPQVQNLLINANRSTDSYRRYGYPVVPDRDGDFTGPLAGIAAALAAAPTELILTVPCDSPLLPQDLAFRLLSSYRSEDVDLCVAHDGQRLQPLFGLFHRRLLDSIEQYLAAGERKFKDWLGQQRHTLVDYSDNPPAFCNVNSPEDVRWVESALAAAQRRGRTAPVGSAHQGSSGQ